MLHHTLFKCDYESTKFIVLIHGFGGNYNVWKNQISILRRFCNVLAIDLPSHYDSNIKLTSLDGNIESVVRKIIEVLKKYSIKHATFMGLSLGTIFIKYMEIFYPQFIEDAILVGALGEVGIFLHILVNVISKIGDKLPSMLVYKVFSKVFMPWKVSKKSREIFCKCAMELSPLEFKAYMFIFKEFFSLNKLFLKKKFKKNLYVSGHGDFCFLKGIEKEVKVTDARLIILKNCGHVCNIDKKDEFNEILAEEMQNTVEHNDKILLAK